MAGTAANPEIAACGASSFSHTHATLRTCRSLSADFITYNKSYDGAGFPTVEFVQGSVSPDGETVLLQLSSGQGPIQLSLRAADLQIFMRRVVAPRHE